MRIIFILNLIKIGIKKLKMEKKLFHNSRKKDKLVSFVLFHLKNFVKRLRV